MRITVISAEEYLPLFLNIMQKNVDIAKIFLIGGSLDNRILKFEGGGVSPFRRMRI